MAITIGNVTDPGSGSGTSRTFSHDNNGRCVVVVVATWDSSVKPTLSATYDGVTMAGLTVGAPPGAGDQPVAQIFWLDNAASGANDVVVTASASVGVLSPGAISLVADGAISVTDEDAQYSGNDIASTSINVSSASGEMVVDAVSMFALNGTTVTAGAGQTARINQAVGSNQTLHASTEAGASPTVTMSWSADANVFIVSHAAASFGEVLPYIIAPRRMPGPPRFDLLITGPLPNGGHVGRLDLPAELALSFGSELPGGWATADIGVVDDPWRVPPDYLRMMTLPDATSAPPFAHIEIRESADLVWEGRLGSRQRHAGELRGIRALGYGITGLRDGRMPAGNGPASARAVVLRALDAWAYPTPRGSSAVQPILVAGQIADTGVMHDWSEFAGRQPYDALDAIAQAGNATWTVYARQLRFFVLVPPSEPDYHIPVDGTVTWEDDYEAVYTTIVLDYSDLDGVRRQITVRDQEAEERYGISRVLPLSGGQMTPSAAAAFARAELARRTRAGLAVSVRRDWQRGLETRGGERPVWRVRAGEWLRVGDEPMQPITGVSYSQLAGEGEVRLGAPVSLSELGQWRRLVEGESATRRGLSVVTRTPPVVR